MITSLEIKPEPRYWTLKQLRNTVFIIIALSSLLLTIRVVLFSPTPPSRSYLVGNDKDDQLLDSLKWYALNSNGSLKAIDNRCIVLANSLRARCSEETLETELKPNIQDIRIAFQDKSYYPNIWRTKNYDKEVLFEFSIFNLDPVKIISKKERSTVLGTELIVQAEFKRKSLSNVSHLLLPSKVTQKLEHEIGSSITLSIAYLPNPYGYHLPVYPLPDILLTPP